jgi:hypothetical protein
MLVMTGPKLTIFAWCLHSCMHYMKSGDHRDLPRAIRPVISIGFFSGLWLKLTREALLDRTWCIHSLQNERADPSGWVNCGLLICTPISSESLLRGQSYERLDPPERLDLVMIPVCYATAGWFTGFVWSQGKLVVSIVHGMTM